MSCTESVAYLVIGGAGIASDAYSFAYVASWAGGGDEASKAITGSAQRIAGAARRILNGLDVDAHAASPVVAA